MPKQRTRKAVSARFKLTKNGKILHRSHKIRHLRSAKSKRQVRSLKRIKNLEPVFAKKIKRMLGKA